MLALLCLVQSLELPTLWQGSLYMPRPSRWCDISKEVSAALPAVSCGLCRVNVGSGHSLALIDPQHLDIGPAALVAPQRRPSVCLVLLDSQLLYPSNLRLTLISDEEETSTAGPIEIMLALETSEGLLSQSPLAPAPAVAIAQATLRCALGAKGVDSDALRQLEASDVPSPALRVYESFLANAANGDPSLRCAPRVARL